MKEFLNVDKMKYTNHIINGEIVDINTIISDKKYFKELTILMGIPVAITGVVILTLAIPFSITFDTCRSLKYFYLKNNRKNHVKFRKILHNGFENWEEILRRTFN